METTGVDVVGATIAENLRAVQERIAAAAVRARRNPAAVQLVAVTKSVGIDEILLLMELGVTHFGENRLPTAELKIGAIRNATWHMIGNIQRRKAKDVVRLFDTVDAVDRIELAEELARRVKPGSTLPILLEVNVSGEESKHGFSPGDVGHALDRIAELATLRAEGLMTMAPFFDDPHSARPVFAGLRELAEQFHLSRLSMGMTNDFEIAIEEGATEVRIGSALFEN